MSHWTILAIIFIVWAIVVYKFCVPILWPIIKGVDNLDK
jgi:hypothetical protein